VSRPAVAIVGLGLVGGSLARALAGKGYRVLGVDSDAATRRAARRSRAFARVSARLEDALAGAELVVLAAPPLANLRLLRQVARAASGPRPVVTDVSSVKRRICALGARLRMVEFVGGHPMAGRERSGFAASDPALFRGRPWILAPGKSRSALRRVSAMARAVGARPLRMSAARHDRAMAFVSHLPQLVAWALLACARSGGAGAPLGRVAGPAFLDMTRIASSPRRLWREILSENRDELGRALRAFRRSLMSSL
jgi:prephenate dehydrogenase